MKWWLLVLLVLAGCSEVQQIVETPADLSADEPTTIKIAMLDIGQGQAILIFFPDKTVLYDGGPRGSLRPYLNQFNVTTLDLAIASNKDADHFAGLIQGFDDVNVLTYAEPDVPCTTKTCTEVDAKADGEGSERPNLVDGDVLTIDGVTLEVLNPKDPLAFTGDNENSIMLKLTYRDFTALFPGDCQYKCESAVVTEYGDHLRSDLYIAGHHGSKTSSSSAFIDAIQPKAALVSVGANNQYHLPSPEVIDRLDAATEGNVYRTDQHGTLIVETDGSAFKIADQNGILLWEKA
ncbi:MAG TPA: ComEC/Rec2 family competence protein [Candidatus Binatia bacterium]|nr:ComEC/Rec2 family competence protein [Candidatus Binatia bacterium]